jgi:hypothetical protein
MCRINSSVDLEDIIFMKQIRRRRDPIFHEIPPLKLSKIPMLGATP